MFWRICYPTASNIRICDPKNIPINHKQEVIGLKILILYSGRLQISRHISLVGIMPLAGNCGETTRLLFWRICYPTAKNIRICDPKNIPINQLQEVSGLKILILYSGRLQISRHNSLVGIMPLVGNCGETTRLMFCRICYPTAKNIRICDPKNIPINQLQEVSGLKILILYSGRLQISRHISLVGICRLQGIVEKQQE